MKKQIIWIILVILWMGVIFHFSAQPGDESQDISGTVSYRVITLTDKVQYTFSHKHWSQDQMEAYAQAIDFPVRKAAHMTEYGILALLSFGMWGQLIHLSKRKHFGISTLTAFIYACTDEFHQLFVAGRSGKFVDVCIDTSGAILFLLLLLLVLHLHAKHKSKHTTQPDS